MDLILNKRFKSIISVVFIATICVSILLYKIEINKKNNYLLFKNKNKIQNEANALQDVVNKTTAKGVVVYDLKNDKILASKNINQVYSLASLTKIINAVLVYEKDKNKLNDIRLMLKTSSNPEAEKLALTLGPDEKTQLEYINNFTKKYKLYFRNVSGLDFEDKISGVVLPGGEGMPLGLLDFIKEYYLKYPEIFDQTIVEDNNTNQIINKLNNLTISKTGFTSLSGGNLFVGIQKGLNEEFFILVLNSTEKNRFVDVQNIADFLVQSSI